MNERTVRYTNANTRFKYVHYHKHITGGNFKYPGLQISVRTGKLASESLFLIQNICCGCSKEPSQ